MSGKARAVVCGIGNVLYGDDGIGPALIRDARGVGRSDGEGGVFLMDCGKSPGQKLREIISLSPSVVILVCAVGIGRGAGTVELLSPEQAKKALLSSHKVDAGMFLRYLQGTLPAGAKIFFIGVQPGPSSQGGMLSPSGKGALIIVRRMVEEILSEDGLRL